MIRFCHLHALRLAADEPRRGQHCCAIVAFNPRDAFWRRRTTAAQRPADHHRTTRLGDVVSRQSGIEDPASGSTGWTERRAVAVLCLPGVQPDTREPDDRPVNYRTGVVDTFLGRSTMAAD